MRKILSILLGAAVTVASIYVVVWLMFTVLTWFLELPPERSTPVAGIAGVLLVPIITYFTSRALERRRSRENAIRERKTELYDQLIRGLMKMLNIGRSKEGANEDFLVELFAEVTPPMITYGSRGVIVAWNRLRTVAVDKPGDTTAMMFAFEDLLKAMRQDLGHTVITHQRGELLGIFVNDIHTLTKKPGKR